MIQELVGRSTDNIFRNGKYDISSKAIKENRRVLSNNNKVTVTYVILLHNS